MGGKVDILYLFSIILLTWVPLISGLELTKESLDRVERQAIFPSSNQPSSNPAQTAPRQNRGISLRTVASPRVSLRFGQVDVRSATTSGIDRYQRVKQKEQELIRERAFVGRGMPARGHAKQFKLKKSSRDEGDAALEVTMASQEMAKRLNLSPQQAALGLTQITLRGTPFEQFCPVPPRCNPGAKYRSVTGVCNNLANPLFGKSNTPTRRVLPPTYDDGVFTQRSKGVDGTPLTNPRMISNNVLLDVDSPDQSNTLSLMQFSQFVDHDLSLSPFTEFINGETIECCPDKRVPNEPVFELCAPIPINATDGFFGPLRESCMNFIRSILAIRPECTFGPAEQIEVLTSWMDASNIYGSEEDDIDRLRERRGGRLLVTAGNLLPFDPEGGECQAPLRGAKCFIAGESRVQEQVGLTAMHTIWHREHNRIANELARLNPRWSDEELFQEARRINAAQYQHIVYEEWLPIILGRGNIAQLGIGGKPSGFSNDYDPTIDPSTGNEFATAAFRYGHSLVVPTYQLITDRGSVNTILLRDHFNSAHFIQQTPGAIDMFIRAFAAQSSQNMDPFITRELSNRLFQTPAVNFGMDLMTLNIQRGRDHGIATYNSIREVCGLPRARTFQDLTDTIRPPFIRRLQSVYKSVDDIDFFAGGILEVPTGGGLLGQTFSCIIGDQFLRARRGDRFFYDRPNQPGSFNAAQLQEIRKASWARVLCNNAENVPSIQPFAFRVPDNDRNPKVPCSGPVIPTINLRLWQNEPTGST